MDRFSVLPGRGRRRRAFIRATARHSAAITMASPLRGPNSPQKEAASPPLIFWHAAQGTGPPLRPQGCFASRWRATALRAALDPGDHCGPWGQEERAGPGLPPRCARRATQRWRHGIPDVTETAELTFDSHKERKITNLGWCQGSSEADPSRIK